MEQRSGFIAVNVGSLFLSFTRPWINPRILVGSVLLIFFSLTLVPCCDVRYDFHIKTMFGSSLSPVVCRRIHILTTLFVRMRIVGYNTLCCLCFLCVFFLRLCCQFLFIVDSGLLLRFSLTFIYTCTYTHFVECLMCITIVALNHVHIVSVARDVFH